MSQAKVDRYKEEKKNRAKTMKRARIKKALIIFGVAIAVGALIGIPLGRWIYNYQQTHVKEEDVFISSHDYTDWFNQYWVDNYADLYTGAELATEDQTTADTGDTEAGSTEGTEAGSTEAASENESASSADTSATQ